MGISAEEIFETIRMIELENLDIRTVTMGISLKECAGGNLKEVAEKIYQKIYRYASKLVSTVKYISEDFGIPIVNTRISVTPVANIIGDTTEPPIILAEALDKVAEEIGIDFIGGYSALVHKGFTRADKLLIASIPEALAKTKRLCASVNIATTRTGINMDAVRWMGEIIKETAFKTASQYGIGCCKLVVFTNAPEDNPFMAGAFHGEGEPEAVINIGISGPGVVKAAILRLGSASLGEIAETIKKTVFKITRVGEAVGREASKRLGVEFGIVDLSLAPSPRVGDSVAEIIEAMGIEKCGAPGSTAALALLVDAVKKGGAMASSYVGGLSGAFIPVSEDMGMVEAVEAGSLNLAKLEAMTAVCSLGIDMVAIPGDTPPETIASIIADVSAIGVINNKAIGVRIIPVPYKKPGDKVVFGGLLGESVIMEVSKFNSFDFIKRGGRIPAPLTSLTN